jgi:Dolichyl-phosphate-mannose-protein mannosyltransferase
VARVSLDSRRAETTTKTWPVALCILVSLVAIGGLAGRVIVYRSSIGWVDADEAVWGLMARHFAHGHFTTFFWGQGYGGTQEVALVGALFAIAGTHVFLMRIVPIALTAVTAFVVWRIGRRTTGELPAITAACLIWIWPPYLLWKLNIWHGFYGSGLLYAALIILFVLRLDESPSLRDAGVLGLLVGLGIWQSVQIVPIAAPAVVWLTLRRPEVWRYAWVAVPASLVGAAPWIVSNLHHDWWSLQLPYTETPYLDRLRGGIDATIPMQLGLRVPFTNEWLLGKAGSGLIYAAVIAVFLAAAWRTRRRRVSLLFLIVGCYPFLYALSGLTWLTNEPRYVIVVVPAFAVLLAAPATTLPRAALVLAVAAALSTAVLGKWIAWSDNVTARAVDRKTIDVRPAILALERAGVDRVYADYWIAYRITFDTREKVIASQANLTNLRRVGPHRVLPGPLRDYLDNRQPAYDRAVRDADRHAYLLLPGDHGTAVDRKLLLENGYSMTRVGPFFLLASPPRPRH